MSARRSVQLQRVCVLHSQRRCISRDSYHDVDDGLRAKLFTLDELRSEPLVGPVLEGVEARYPGLSGSRLKHEMVRRMIDNMVRDLTDETRRNIDEFGPESAQDIRNAGRAMVEFSPEMREQVDGLRRFLHTNMYRHPRVVEAAAQGKQVVSDLFSRYMADPKALPEEWRMRVGAVDDTSGARIVADFIAGMTDRFAINEHERLFGKK